MMDGARFAALCRASGEGMPYPDLTAPQERVLVDALRAAWDRLRAAYGGVLAQWSEDQTTERLEAQLNALLDDEAVAGFSREFVGVAREPKVVNHDGRHPDKMPDLAFSLRRREPGLRADYSLHVECKPVNRRDGMSPYCDQDGMGKFIRGDYACKMRAGFMVAYAADGYTFAGKVAPKLRRSFNKAGDPYATTRLVDAAQTPESQHHRSWVYANGSAPGDIRLLHVWLTVAAPGPLTAR